MRTEVELLELIDRATGLKADRVLQFSTRTRDLSTKVLPFLVSSVRIEEWPDNLRAAIYQLASNDPKLAKYLDVLCDWYDAEDVRINREYLINIIGRGVVSKQTAELVERRIDIAKLDFTSELLIRHLVRYLGSEVVSKATGFFSQTAYSTKAIRDLGRLLPHPIVEQWLRLSLKSKSRVIRARAEAALRPQESLAEGVKKHRVAGRDAMALDEEGANGTKDRGF